MTMPLAAFALASLLTATVALGQARNPVIWADVPDVAVVRVGGVYYMSSTTMHANPGVPFMRSRDLVNWEPVSYAYDTLGGDDDRLTLTDGKSEYGRGSWASSLRHHDGTFYVTTFSRTTNRTYVYTTTDPERSPWKVTSFAPALHDHSLVFDDDDGRAYMVHGAGDLRLTELNADLSGVKAGGVDKVIIANASAVSGKVGLPAEGSQVTKVDGRYYLLNITWPPGGMRTVVVHRADKLEGPWEGRVALQDKGVAQGCLIDAPDGKWWAMLFEDRGAVGRTPWLVPVTWRDGWPVFGVDGKAPEVLEGLPANKGGVPSIVASDEFDRAAGDAPLGLAWQWNHVPDPAGWAVASGQLRLTTRRVDGELTQARNTLTQRTFGPTSAATTVVDARALKDGDHAGLCAFQKRYGYVGVTIDAGKRSIVMVSAETEKPVELARVPTDADRVFLRVECDFRARADVAHFSYSLDGERWTRVGAPLRMAYTLPHFMGYRFGLFCFSTKAAGGSAAFDFFRVGDRIDAP